MRARGLYVLTVLVAILLGIGSREYASVLPHFIAEHFGDALWAAMIYLGLRAVLFRMSIPQTFILSLGFCFAIECSQLYQAAWINDFRSTLLGGLILGRGFLYIDLVRYSAGAISAYALDRLILIPISVRAFYELTGHDAQ
ncbi:putative membrane protein YjgA [Paenibacillus sp. CCS19]|uniref:ribosomal maturation YjgA family protein n=1 Tax=Paenibacillus sp. CCS19 TaxID=3158387 RepID=UPI002569DA62|nr:DUF2809 domain-containing protein [Paenibacillus cellulosilyticus]GMK40419.1 putative membrane protein YjgA [Paenibacillus cellulosilyticus]